LKNDLVPPIHPGPQGKEGAVFWDP